MGRKTSVDYTAINIRVHPHPTKQIYVDLFKAVFSTNRRIPLGHNVSAKMTRLWELREGKPLEGLVGEIAKYNDINDDSWFNIETGKAADPDELDEINIPEDLRPNCDTFYFIFFPKDHILVSEIRDKDGSFSPKMQEKFFNFLFSPKEITEQFKAIDVTIFPDTTQIAKILNSKTLKKLELIINRPNPDDFEIFEQEILAEMEEQNAKVYEKKLIAQDKEYLDPNEKTKKQIQVAADNGKVIYSEVDLQTGLTNRDKSTEETPFIYRDRYDPAETTPLDFIKIKATEIAQKLKDRLK